MGQLFPSMGENCMDKFKGNSKPKKYEIVWIALVLGFAVFVVGTVLAGMSASYSKTGFEATWPEVPNVGWIGVLVAALAYMAFFAPPLLQKNIAGWKGWVASALCLICGGFLAYGDGYGNAQAMRADVIGETTTYKKLSGEYDTAKETMPVFLDDAASIKETRKILREAFEFVPTDNLEQKEEKIRKAQSVLLETGQYAGRIDGKPLKKTEDAARALGPVLQRRLDELQVRIDEANSIIARGEPIQPNMKKSEAAEMIGFGVTLAGVFCSFFSGLLLQVGLKKAPEPEEAEPDYLSDEHLVRMQEQTAKNLKLVSGKVAAHVLSMQRNQRKS
jgi:hypothetical protein